jgi:hypothetical protein
MRNLHVSALATFWCLFAGFASATGAADRVIVKGYVTDLQGRPHINSDITIRVSSVDKEIDAKKAGKDGSFTFSINPAALPLGDATLRFAADGGAFLNGAFVRVTTNGTLFGLAGRADAKLAGTPQFVLLVVPKTRGNAAPCYQRRSRRCHRWR